MRLTEAQRQAADLVSRHGSVLLYGGSRSGKSMVLARLMLARALLAPGSRHAVLRRHLIAARQSFALDTLAAAWASFDGLGPFRPDKTDWVVRLANGSEVWIGGLDDSERVDRILGTEYSTLLLEECSQISWDSVSVARTRLAQTVGLRPLLWATCNPPARSHWAHRVWIEGRWPEGDPMTPEERADHGSMLMNPDDNRENLPEGYIERTLETLPRRQRARFRFGEWADDTEGALWTEDMLTAARGMPERPTGLYRRTVVGVDPSGTRTGDLWGVVAARLHGDGTSRVLRDDSLRASPLDGARAAARCARQVDADALVVETNMGGHMASTLLRTAGWGGRIVEVHASEGKTARAEPVSALYERGLVAHAPGLLRLEDELASWTPDLPESPDRLDALVWALTELHGVGRGARREAAMIPTR